MDSSVTWKLPATTTFMSLPLRCNRLPIPQTSQLKSVVWKTGWSRFKAESADMTW